AITQRGGEFVPWLTSIMLASTLDAKPMGHKQLTVRFRVLLRFELESQLVDLACELEGDIVTILEQADPGAGVLTDVERFAFRERNRGGVLQRIPSHLLAVYRQYTGASLAQPRTIGPEVEDDGVLSSLQLRSLPRRALEVEQIVEEHDLAAAESKFALAQEQA